MVFLTPYIIEGDEDFPEEGNVWYGETVTQRRLLEEQMSLAVKDLQEKKSILGEMPPPEEAIDMTSRISENLEWFNAEEWSKRAKEVKEAREAKEKVGIEPEAKGAAMPFPGNITPLISGYYTYFENLRNKIHWVAKDNYPGDLKGKKEDVNILFTLTDDGYLKGEPRVLNEVTDEVALAAKSAVEDAAPFPPFPRKIEKEEETFRITIMYE